MSALTTPIAIHPLSRQEVEAAVKSYWTISTSRQAEKQAACYDDNAWIFTSSSRRLEPARLVLMRRHREYMMGSTRLQAEIGRIEVDLTGPNVAVAAYTMQFDAQRKPVFGGGPAKAQEEHLKNARVTHVFVRDPDGVLKIVHEHISIPDA